MPTSHDSSVTFSSNATKKISCPPGSNWYGSCMVSFSLHKPDSPWRQFEDPHTACKQVQNIQIDGRGANNVLIRQQGLLSITQQQLDVIDHKHWEHHGSCSRNYNMKYSIKIKSSHNRCTKHYHKWGHQKGDPAGHINGRQCGNWCQNEHQWECQNDSQKQHIALKLTDSWANHGCHCSSENHPKQQIPGELPDRLKSHPSKNHKGQSQAPWSPHEPPIVSHKILQYIARVPHLSQNSAMQLEVEGTAKDSTLSSRLEPFNTASSKSVFELE